MQLGFSVQDDNNAADGLRGIEPCMNNTATELSLACFDVDNVDDMMRLVVSEELIFVFEAQQKNTGNSCNKNPHTLYSRQYIYSSSQSVREGQEENLEVALKLTIREDDRCDRHHHH